MSSPSRTSSGDSTTDSARTWSDIRPEDIPPAVIHADLDDDGASVMFNDTVDKRGRKIQWSEVNVPRWLREHDAYKDGDWRVFLGKRRDGKKDWNYIHREYCKKLRSTCEVELFLSDKGSDKMFKGRKLRKKKTKDHNGQARGASKSRRGMKASNTSTRALTIGNPPVMPDKPAGFV